MSRKIFRIPTIGNDLDKYQFSLRLEFPELLKICLTIIINEYRILRNYNLQYNYCYRRAVRGGNAELSVPAVALVRLVFHTKQ
jgi:hypothetical protein